MGEKTVVKHGWYTLQMLPKPQHSRSTTASCRHCSKGHRTIDIVVVRLLQKAVCLWSLPFHDNPTECQMPHPCRDPIREDTLNLCKKYHLQRNNAPNRSKFSSSPRKQKGFPHFPGSFRKPRYLFTGLTLLLTFVLLNNTSLQTEAGLDHFFFFIIPSFLTFLFLMDKVKLTPNHAAITLEPDKEVTSRVENSCLIGKIILDRPLGARDVKCIASLQWKCEKDFSVSYVDRNTFMFSFQGKEDWTKVLLNAPWTIKGGLLILCPFISGKIPEEMQLSFSPFWVQVHGLPLNYLTKENGIKIGQVLGKFLYVDGNVFDGKALGRKFLRIRVVLAVTKPLLSGFWVRRTGLTDIWIEFKYEKLGVFCYKCGRIGNYYRNCKFPALKAKFGPWLQAEPLSDFLGVASSPSAVGGGATVVVERETNLCTTLITVSQADPRLLIQSSSSEPEIYQEVEPEDISLRLWNLRQRLIVNGVDSLAMVANCAMICCRVSLSNAYNWRLLMVMVAYFSYLVLKLIRVIQSSWLLKSFNRQPTCQEHNLMALMEILILVVFFAMLKSS